MSVSAHRLPQAGIDQVFLAQAHTHVLCCILIKQDGLNRTQDSNQISRAGRIGQHPR